MANASSSVLKLVIAVQRIGKKITKPTAQAAIVRRGCVASPRSFLPSLSLQVPADDADEEEGDDIGDHHSDQTAGGSGADVEVHQRLRIDQEGDVGRLQAGAAAGGDVDFGEDGEQEDRLDHDHDGDRAREVRQRDVPEVCRALAPSISAASLCSSSSDCRR